MSYYPLRPAGSVIRQGTVVLAASISHNINVNSKIKELFDLIYLQRGQHLIDPPLINKPSMDLESNIEEKVRNIYTVFRILLQFTACSYKAVG